MGTPVGRSSFIPQYLFQLPDITQNIMRLLIFIGFAIIGGAVIANERCYTDLLNDGVRTPLEAAAECGLLKNVKELLDGGADPDGKNLLPYTPLIYAVQGPLTGEGYGATQQVESRIEIIKELLQAGADIELTYQRTKETPLMKAAYLSVPQVVSILIEHHADVNAKDHKGRTALMHALDNKRYALQIAKILLDNGADVKAKDDQGNTANDIINNCN